MVPFWNIYSFGSLIILMLDCTKLMINLYFIKCPPLKKNVATPGPFWATQGVMAPSLKTTVLRGLILNVLFRPTTSYMVKTNMSKAQTIMGYATYKVLHQCDISHSLI